jgi:hypothetical protein
MDFGLSEEQQQLEESRPSRPNKYGSVMPMELCAGQEVKQMAWWNSLPAIRQMCGLRETVPFGNPWGNTVTFKGHRFTRVNVDQRQTDAGENVALYYCGCGQMAVRYGASEKFMAIEDDGSEHELSACELLAN